MQHQTNQNQTNQLATTSGQHEPAIKKRKLETNQSTAATTMATTTAIKDLKADSPLQFFLQDVSFAVPQRKKLTLEMTAAGGYLRARNQTSKEIEFGIPITDIRECPFFLFA